MTDYDAFLDAIAEDPHDDAPRLIFADWLDEHDQPARAELIRVEYELRQRSSNDPGRRKLHRRALEIIEQHKDEWGARLLRQLGVWWETDRGLIDRLSGNFDAIAGHADELLSLGPITRIDVTYRVYELLEPQVNSRRRHSVLKRIPVELVTQLAACPLVSRLEQFISQVPWTSEAIISLAQGPHWKRLRRLNLQGLADMAATLSTRAATALAHADFPRLEQINLLNQRFNRTGTEILLEAFGDRVLLTVEPPSASV